MVLPLVSRNRVVVDIWVGGKMTFADATAHELVRRKGITILRAPSTMEGRLRYQV